MPLGQDPTYANKKNTMNIAQLLADLEARLPELEWKFATLGIVLSPNSLPKGLFYLRQATTASACVAEIKDDIQALTLQKNESSSYYLAKRIHQKINVLVILCQIQANKPKKEEKIHFGVKQLSTRQQWLQTLENDIRILKAQQQALTKTLQQMQSQAHAQAILNLQAELGKLEKHLTLAQETYARSAN